jgi:RNA polymerase sigma factor (sigma-70 family)
VRNSGSDSLPKSLCNLVNLAFSTYTSDKSDHHLEQLFKLLRQLSRSITWNLLHSPNDEVAEEAAEHVVLVLESFKDNSSFSTWAWTIIQNHIKDWLDSNSSRTRAELSTEHLPPEDFQALSYDPHKEGYCRFFDLRRALEALPRANRVVVNLVLKGYTFEEVGEKLSIPVTTAYARWTSALRALKNSRRPSTKKSAKNPSKESEWKA